MSITNCNVLVVDDSAILRAAIKKTVKVAGVHERHISEAANGRDALDILADSPIDIVLLDLHMPVMDGEQFLDALRADPRLSDTAVVVVSTEGNKARLDRLREKGVLDILHKPFEPEDLCHIIARLLGVRQ